MPSYDYSIAQGVLTDTEKNRIVCLYLSSDTPSVNNALNWEKATTAFQSASVSSMKVSLANSLKKIADKGGKEGADATPTKAKATSSKKRKTEHDADDLEGAPNKRGGERKKKDACTTPAAEGDLSVSDLTFDRC
ncbi:hypothetical protein LTR53_010572 [Teratosphaeriaceae sp. CCFEE 6253]|nr:hypothetical protein LTR53_010572 [Teratosphaeriaceae sp. CCFEE 6253]